jgi:peptide deformylase
MSSGKLWPNGSERVPSPSLTLRTLPDPVLRRVCDPVESFGLSLRELVGEMRQVMLRHRGIGLAAPQAGLALRLFVAELHGRRLSIVNPRIHVHGACSEELEGCLSLPGVEVPVTRPSAVELRGWTPKGKAVSLDLEGFWARLVQHEVDHLNGRLISDCAPEAVGAGRTTT